MPASRVCKTCGVEKPLTDFSPNKACSEGRHVHCRDCMRPIWRANATRYKDQQRERDRARYYADREAQIQRVKNWRSRNKQKCADTEARRRARMRGNTVETVDREAIIKRDGSICHLCKKRVDPEDIQLDHLIPVCHGGAHVESNLAVAHRVCNQRRGDGRIPAQLRLH